MIKYIYLFAFTLAFNGISQTDSSAAKISFSGYIDTYYSYDLGVPENHTRPNFIYSNNRTNEVNINLAFVKAAYAKKNVRANLALMAGTYSNANLASEPGLLRNIFEANVGVKISKTKNLWIDAGIFSSHIGFESAVSKDCWNLTRSILAENSPYYESGVKLTYVSKNEKLLLSGLVLNGWQRIQRMNGNNSLCLGHQFTYKPSSKLTLNSSSFVGSDAPDSLRVMRYFHNFYGQLQCTKKIGLIVGFDFGTQQKYKGSRSYSNWFSPVLIAKFTTSPKTALAVRGELYKDANGVIISTGTMHGFETYGYSMNFDYTINENVVWRIEAKGLQSKDKVFMLNNKASNQNFLFSTSLAISF